MRQASRDTVVKALSTEKDPLKPGNVWAVKKSGEIVQVDKREFEKNRDQYKEGPFYNWGIASMYKESKGIFKEQHAQMGQDLQSKFKKQRDKLYAEYCKEMERRGKTPKSLRDFFLSGDLIKMINKDDSIYKESKMSPEKRKRLERGGWKVGSAKEFLESINPKVLRKGDELEDTEGETWILKSKAGDEFLLKNRDSREEKLVKKDKIQYYGRRVNEGSGDEFTDAEQWMNIEYDTLDDKDYLIRGAMKKFKLPRSEAEKVYNKVMRDRDPEMVKEESDQEKKLAAHKRDIEKRQDKVDQARLKRGIHPVTGEKLTKESYTESPIFTYTFTSPTDGSKIEVDVDQRDYHFRGASIPPSATTDAGKKYNELKLGHILRGRLTKMSFLQMVNTLRKLGFKVDKKEDKYREYGPDPGDPMEENKLTINPLAVDKMVKEWMGGMIGIPNRNIICEKCGMPSNACECQQEEDRKKNTKAQLPKGVKMMKEMAGISGDVKRVAQDVWKQYREHKLDIWSTGAFADEVEKAMKRPLKPYERSYAKKLFHKNVQDANVRFNTSTKSDAYWQNEKMDHKMKTVLNKLPGEMHKRDLPESKTKDFLMTIEDMLEAGIPDNNIISTIKKKYGVSDEKWIRQQIDHIKKNRSVDENQESSVWAVLTKDDVQVTVMSDGKVMKDGKVVSKMNSPQQATTTLLNNGFQKFKGVGNFESKKKK